MRVGFLINPIAGMGGKVGLKGTDGVVKEAIEMGAKPVAHGRALNFLTRLKALGLGSKIQLLACPSVMGDRAVKEAGLDAKVLPMKVGLKTTAEDTKEAVRLMVEGGVDLITFVGGDGTARDILDALRNPPRPPVLGVPSGVKMYSGVFAVNPEDAAYIVEAFVQGAAQQGDFEVMDADEAAIRSNYFSVRLYGILRGPFLPTRIQGSKQVSPDTLDEQENQLAVARFIVEEMDPEATYILGPGTTVKRVANLLRADKTILGVDVYHKGSVTNDVNEEKLLNSVKDWQNTWIIVSPIGRQGILFGRGNQQISPRIIRLVGKERIIALATKSKIRSIEGNVLRVDTGEAEADRMLRGYFKVATDYREWRLMRIV